MHTGDQAPNDGAAADGAAVTVLDYPSGPGSAPLSAGAGPARRHSTVLQRAGAALIAGACIFAAAWYVPGIVAADGRSLAGTVTSNGTIYLNFSGSGKLAKITARIGQHVRKGELLATEAAPARGAVLTADRAVIAADQAQLHAANGRLPARDRHRASAAGQGQGPGRRRPCRGRRHPDLRAVGRDRGSHQRPARRDRRCRGHP